ncbi:MAG TPA: heat-inducible transcriptional repressor HrcA [Acidimicrobiia bacterium]|nr:heat-inducible transcriptional repressor HrcA [Acidimicrobiia bacterium]
MAPTSARDKEFVVDDRKKTILRTVVDSYVDDATPVASKTVSERSALDVSAATIRNDMHALEDAGYLTHTHTSSGRIPTDQGYRFFVDNFVPADVHNKSRRAQSQLIDGMFSSSSVSHIDTLLEQTVILLSSLTHHTAVIVKDASSTARVSDVHISRLGDGRVVVALFLDDSTIERVVVEAQCLFDDRASGHEEVDDRLLAHRVQDLRDFFCGHTLRDVLRENSPAQMASFTVQIKDAFAREVRLDQPEASVHIAGVANIAKAERDADRSVISSELLSLLEQHMMLIELIRGSVDDTIAARIGSENMYDELSRHSMVLAPFVSGDGDTGAVGIIGPTRMDYSQVFAYLNAASGTVTKFLDQ